MEYVTERHIRVCWRLVGLPSPVVLVKVAVGTHDDCEVVHNGVNLQPASCLDGFNARSQLNYILENFSLPQAVTDDGWQMDGDPVTVAGALRASLGAPWAGFPPEFTPCQSGFRGAVLPCRL